MRSLSEYLRAVGVGKMKGKKVVFNSYKCAGVESSEIIKSFHGSSRSGLDGRTELYMVTCLINSSLPYTS